MATIAFCGLGMMGWKMAERLRDAGHTLQVWNRSSDKAKAWTADGGIARDSPEQAARGASQVHTMVADDEAVDAILFGSHGVLKGLSKGALVVDHSTVSVGGAKERSARIHSEGWRFLQCPVFGSPPQIGEGKGLMLIGGERLTYEQAKETLHDILADHFFAGEEAQDASTFKLMGNSMLVCIVEALSEFFVIAKANKIEPQRALSLLSVFNPCGTLQRRGPRMASGDYASMFSLSMALKDVRLILEAVGQESQLPVAETIAAKMKRLISEGYADLDLAALGLDVVPAAR